MPGAEASQPISVVVCTRDRPDSIGPTLDSIARQRSQAVEVLVVDQSKGERTRQVVDEFQAKIAQLRYLHLERPGLSHAYNTAIRATTAPLLAFTDDDAAAPPDWLDSIAAAFTGHPGVDLVYGQVLIPDELVERENRDGVTPGLPIPRRRLLDRAHGFEVFGMGANFAARRRLFEEVGGFDEMLGGGAPLQSSQDFDFGYRVYRSGRSTLLEPDVVVYHYGFRSHDEWPATVRSYGVGVGGFYFKHVRLGDAYAARLLVQTLLGSTARWLKRLVRRQPATTQWAFVRNIVRGMLRSTRYPVDRRLRVYRSPA
jgi:glycosyltransferase involved in cell wall biosynthesis